MVIITPSFALVLMMRSQNFRRLLSPTPRSAEHENVDVMSAAGAPMTEAASTATPIERSMETSITALFAELSAMPNEFQELRPGSCVFAENPVHRAGHRDRVLFLHAAHGHTEVRRLHDYGDAERLRHLVNRVGDLLREALLHLEPPREHIDDSRQLRQADDPFRRQVGHVALAEERQQMMFAETVERSEE